MGSPSLSRVNADGNQLPQEFRRARSRIMYIEDKSEGLEGEARIGRVYYSKSGRSLYYRGRRFERLMGRGYKANYFETTTGDHYWISGPRKDRHDRLYGGNLGVVIDEDAFEDYVMFLAGEKNSAPVTRRH